MKLFTNNNIFVIILTLALIIMTIQVVDKSISTNVTNMPVTNKIIMIDAGHGGVDAGASSENNVYEKDISLKITNKLRMLLEESGALVVLSREIDESPGNDGKYIYKKTLEARKQLLKESKPDAFVSIHLNAFDGVKCKGAQTFYPKDDMQSQKLALYIQEELKRVLNKQNNREIKFRDDLYLLKGNEIPSVLIECGFLSNYEEEKLLNSDEYQDKIAWSIYVGIQKYFNSII